MSHIKPSLLLDESKVRNNIERIANKASKSQTRFQPHFKTHQSPELGKIFGDFGVSNITVSNIQMAFAFADDGWNDIMLALPVPPDWAASLDELAQKTDTLSVIINSPETVLALEESINNPIYVYVELDTGQHRSGVDPKNFNKLRDLAQAFNKTQKLNLAGFYTHPGHTYRAVSKAQIEKIHKDALSLLQNTRDLFASEINMGSNKLEIILGDTPSCSIIDEFSSLDAITPGNLVFYDIQQFRLGACEINDIAVALEAKVLENNVSENQLIIHGGAVHLSKDTAQIDGNNIFGLICLWNSERNSWSEPIDGAFIRSISQEHGVIHYPGNAPKLESGDSVYVLPCHSCLTANLMQRYWSLKKQKWIDMYQ